MLPCFTKDKDKGISIFKGLSGDSEFEANWRNKLVAFVTRDRVVKNFILDVQMGSEFISEQVLLYQLLLIEKGGLHPLRLLPLITQLSVLMPLQGITPGTSWIGGVSSKDYKTILKIKMREIKTK